MEVRKKFYTFGEALNKVQRDPENLAMSRQKYLDKNIYIKEYIPNFSEVDYGDYPMLIAKSNDDIEIFVPSQDDLHANNWILLRKKVKSTVNNETKQSQVKDEFIEKFMDLLKEFNNLFSKYDA